MLERRTTTTNVVFSLSRCGFSESYFFSLCTSLFLLFESPHTLDNRPIQMQSSGQCFSVEFAALAAEDRAENSEVLKFQREGIRTRRSRLSLWCRSKRVYARVKMMGFELSLKKIARSAKLQECSGMIPTTFTNIIEQSSKKWRAGISLAGNEGRSPHTRYRVSPAVAGTKCEALSN